MDKKSLVAFVMTAPVMSMFASNWSADKTGYLSYTLEPNFTTGNWTSASTSLPDPTVSSANGIVTISNLCPSISSSFTLPQGNYELSYNGLANAEITIQRGANDPAPVKFSAKEATSAQITVGPEGTAIVVTVTPKDGKKTWNVPKLTLKLDFNFATTYSTLFNAWDDLQSRLKNDGIASTDSNLRNSEIDALKKRFKALQEDSKTLSNEIANINPTQGKDESLEAMYTRLLASYNTYKLHAPNAATSYNVNNTIATGIKALDNNLGIYEDDVKAENKVIKTINDNSKAKEELIGKDGKGGKIKELTNAVKGKSFDKEVGTAEVKDNAQLTAYNTYIAANAVNNINTAISNLQKAVNEAYKDLMNANANTVALMNQALSIENQIKALANGYTGAAADWNAYKYFLSPASNGDNAEKFGVAKESKNLADVELIQTTEFQKIDNLAATNIAGFGKIYADQVDKYKAELNDIYLSNLGYTINPEGGMSASNPNIAGASLNYPTANSGEEKYWGMNYRIDNMPSVYAGFKAMFDRENGAYKAADAYISGLKIGGKSVEEVLQVKNAPGFDDLDNAEDLEELIGNIQTAYDNLKETVKKLYTAHKLAVTDKYDASDGTGYAYAYYEALSEFNSAANEYTEEIASAEGDLKDKLGIMGKYASTKATVKEELSDLKQYADKIEAHLDDSFTTVEGWVDEYIAQVDAATEALAEKKAKNEELDAKQQELTDLVNTQLREKGDVEIKAIDPETEEEYVVETLEGLPRLKEELKEAKTALDIAQAEYLKHQQNQDLSAAELQQKLKDFEDAKDAYTDAQIKVNELEKAIIDAKAEQPKVQAAIEELLDGVAEADQEWQDAEDAKKSLLSSINSACSSIVKNAKELKNAFKPAEDDIATLATAVSNLNKDVKNAQDTVSANSKIVTITVSGTPAYTYKADDASVSVTVPGKKASKWGPTQFENQYNDLKQILEDIADGEEAVTINGTTYDCSNPTQFLNAAKALDEVLQNGSNPTFSDYIATARVQLAKAIADANLEAITALDKLLNGTEENPSQLSLLKQVQAPGSANLTVQANFNPGYNGPTTVSEINTNVTNAASQGTVAKKLQAYSDADGYMIAFSKAYQQTLEKVKPVYDNYMDWRRLRNALGLEDKLNEYIDGTAAGMNPKVPNQKESCVQNLEDAKDYVNAITDASAKPFYQNELQKISDKITAEGNKVTADYMDMVADDNYNDLLAEIKALNTEIDNLEKACLANQQKYGALSSKVDNLSKYANSIADFIKANDEVTSDDVEKNKEYYLNQIQEQLDNLKKISSEITNAFKNGAVVADDAADQKNFTGRLNDIEKALSNIETTEDRDYKQAVIDANKAFLGKFGITYDALYQRYNEAVDTVNAYRYNINNPEYYAALVGDDNFQKTHYAVQQTYLDLEKYNTDYDPWFKSLTPGNDRSKWVVLASFITFEDDDLLPEFQPAKMPSAQDRAKLQKEFEDYLAAGQEIWKSIEDKQNAVTDCAYGIAQKFFADNYTDGGKVNYEAARAALVAAGLTEEWTKVGDDIIPSELYVALSEPADLYGSYWGIQKIYFGKEIPANTDPKKFVENPEDHVSDVKTPGFVALQDATKYNYILGMSTVADYIVDLIPSISSGLTNEQFVNKVVNTGVANAWDTYVKELVAELQGYVELSKEDAGYGKTADLENAISQVNAIDGEWAAYVLKVDKCAAEYLNYKGKIDKAIGKTLKKAQEYALESASKTAKAALYATAASVEADLNKLLETYSGYHANQVAIYNGYLKDINDIVNEIKEYDGVPDQADYKKKFDAIQVKVTSDLAYESMLDAECDYAKTMLIAKLKAAFNNAKVNKDNPLTTKEIKDYLETIEGYEADIETVGNKPFTMAGKDALMSEILDIEDDICASIVELEKRAGTPADRTEVQITLTKYQTLYKNVSDEVTRYLDAVNAAADKTEGYGQKTSGLYAPQFEALNGELDDVASLVNVANPSDDIIYEYDELQYKLNQISEKAKKIQQAWSDQNDEDVKFYTSDVLWQQYSDELDGLLLRINEVHGLVEANDPTYVDTEYDKLLNDVNKSGGIKKQLADGKKAHSFTKEGKNPVADFNVEATQYVKDMLEKVFKIVQNKNSWTIYNEYLAVFENEKLNSDNGWKLDYVNATKLMDELIALRDKMDAVNSDPKKDPIQWIADPENPKKMVATNADEAYEGYESLVKQMNAILDEMNELLKSEVGQKYLKGDVNNDGDLTVADIQKLITMVGEGVEYTPGDIKSETADVNGDNAINIADVTALINRVLNEQNSNKPAKLARYISKASGNNSFVCEEIQGVNGLRRFAVVLNNEVDFVSGQLDVVLPAYAHVAGVTLAQRANGLDSYVFENDGFTRVVFTSLDNEAAIEGNNGTLLYIDVEGDADIKLDNLIFSDANANSYDLSNGTTGVGIIDSMMDGVKSIYNAAGQKLRNLTKGVNIIRNADGTTTKKIGK